MSWSTAPPLRSRHHPIGASPSSSRPDARDIGAAGSGSAKRRILDTAADLFYRHGYHAVGVDQVVEQAVRRRLRDLAAAADAADPSTLADGLLLLMDGAFAAARMYQWSSPAAHVADAARVLIDAHSGSGPRRRRAGR